MNTIKNIGMIGNKDDPNSQEKLGYYGELIVLQATEMRLGTCWVGGTFDRESCPFTLSDVTQDCGLAAMVIGKGAIAINQNGLIISDKNMDRLLLERHIGKEIRRAGGKT